MAPHSARRRRTVETMVSLTLVSWLGDKMATPDLDAAAAVPVFCASLVKELEDEQYRCLEKWFCAKGRGRRVDLPPGIELNYRIFLQLSLLQAAYGKTRKFVEDILCRLFPFISELTEHQFRSIFERCVRATGTPQDDDWKIFLSQSALTMGPFEKYAKRNGMEHITRADLLGDHCDLNQKLSDIDVIVTNEFVVKLERFRVKENENSVFTQELLRCFNFQIPCSAKQAKKAIDNVVNLYNKLQKSKNKNPAKLILFENFCSEQFTMSSVAVPNPPLLVEVPDERPSPSTETDTEAQPVQEAENLQVQHQEGSTSTGTSQVLVGSRAAQLGTELRLVKGKLCELVKVHEQCGLKLEVLTQEKKKKEQEIAEKDIQFSSMKSELVKLKQKLENSQSQLALVREQLGIMKSERDNLKSELSSSHQSAYYKKLKRKEDLFEMYESFFKKHNEEDCEKRLKSLQTQLSNYKTLVEGLRGKSQADKNQIKLLKKECDQYAVQIVDIEPLTLVTKDGNQFTDAVVRCIIQLIGEVGIPACRCSSAIKCVSECLFNVLLNDKDLPSNRSNMRFADRGNVISTMHLAETILESDGFDLHTDGTSRSNRCYVGNQATISTGRVMSFGYNMVVTEDTETLLDLATRLLMELSDVYTTEDGDPQQTYKDLLRKMISLMSDRASVMKSFNNAMNHDRNETLGLGDDDDADCQLQYLYCNAHFLLGLSHEAEKALKEVQKDHGKLGRDTMPVFKSYSGSAETTAARLIRTGCDVLGPRGDEKNGCRSAWEAYCTMKGSPSRIKSFRGNRFNNFFEAASAIHFHRSDIIDFFLNYREAPNLKLQSVLADCKSDIIDDYMCAIGIAFYVVTGPYWKLVTSDVKYLDLYKYIVPMREKFVTYSADASSLVGSDLISVIPDFSIESGDEGARLKEVADKKIVQETLQQLFKGFLAVTDRQLFDFLPGGRYHDIQDQSLRQKMQHCQLTNLTGEANLADLDFSLFTKRNATLHHRGMTNMMKRNKPMSTWFNLKSEMEQGNLLSRSAKKAQTLRLKHREDERNVKIKHQDRILAVNLNLLKKREKAVKRKAELSEKVKLQGGPCLRHKNVDVLLKKCPTATKKKTALNNEIQYLKVVLGAKSSLLVSSKLPWETVAKNLKTYLASLAEENDGEGLPVATEEANALPPEPEGDIASDDEPQMINSDGDDEFRDDFPSDSDHGDSGPTSSEEGDDDSESDSASEMESESTVELEEMETDETGNQPNLKRKSDATNDDATPAKMPAPAFEKFRFTSPGEWVAVYYDDEKQGHLFYIGQVLEIREEDKAVVTFLEQCSMKSSQNMYRFPGSLDIDTIERKFVFHANFLMTTTNGRMWTLQNPKELKRIFKQYIRTYCRA